MTYQGEGLSLFGQGVCENCGIVFDCPVDELGHQTERICNDCYDFYDGEGEDDNGEAQS